MTHSFLSLAQFIVRQARGGSRWVVGLWVGFGAVSGAWGQLPAYDFGNPSATEQYFIELINAARSSPAGEAQRLSDSIDPAKPGWEMDWDIRDAMTGFGVATSVMVQQISALPTAPPLAPNAKLMAVARSHTQWMWTNKAEEHWEVPGMGDAAEIVRRISGVGYAFSALGENIYAYGLSLNYAHAGFEVDWGGPSFGMQNPPYHRVNNHSGDYRELGVGILLGYNGSGASQVGPVVGTVNFGQQPASPAFVTGVAYYDLNANGFYDVHEGISGLRVDVTGAAHSAVTAPGGGFVVPVPALNGPRSVLISGLNAELRTECTIIDGKNVGLKYVPEFKLLEVPVPFFAGDGSSELVMPPVVGATGYGLMQAGRIAAAPEPGDSSSEVTYFVSRNGQGQNLYPPVQTQTKAAGSSAAFHLAHPLMENQWIMLNSTYLCRAGSSMSFQSRLAAANVRQVARVQASTDDGVTWSDLVVDGQLPQAGTGATGQTAFGPKTVPLSSFAGRLIRIRFVYTLAGHDPIIVSTNASSGWFIDSITFIDTDQVAAPVMSGPVSDPRFIINRPSSLPAIVAARPHISGRFWDWGPVTEVTAENTAGYLAWALNAEARCGLAEQTLSADPAGDCSGNGVPHILKYALGLNPASHSAESAPTAILDGERLVLKYARDLTKSDVAVSVECSSDLKNWFGPGDPASPDALTDTVLETSGHLQFREASVPRGGGSVYLRLKSVR
ncbi:MAG: hypothetical protein ACR2OZ_17765 [Verrucomicrobiales bacterium]